MAKQKHDYSSGRIQRAENAEDHKHSLKHAGTGHAAAPKKKKRRALRVVLAVFLCLVLLAASAFAVLHFYLDSVFVPGTPGVIHQKNYTPKEYQSDVINILFVGIFRKPTDTYPDGLGLTDMILYANYDIKNNKLNLLQIPRDSYVGEIEGSDGKINSLMVTGEDKTSPINNLVACIVDQYKLPIDRYICMDMEALKEIVDVFASIRVYVPKDMSYGGGSLQKGWQWLDRDSVEFFLRTRYGEGFARADIDRLENQRHFYSALFRRFLKLSIADIFKLLPLFEEYCNTDFSTYDLYDLAFTALKLTPENVLFCMVPGATGAGNWQADPLGFGRTFFIVDVGGRGTENEPGIANLLNQYFRTYGGQVAAEELNFPNVSIPPDVALYPPSVRIMQQLQEDEGGTEIPVEPS